MAPTGNWRGAAMRAAGDVRQAQQRAAAQSGAGRHQPVIGSPERQSDQVRGHQSNEADGAGRQHGQRGQRGGDHEDHRPRHARVEPEDGTAQLAGGQHVQRTPADQRGEHRQCGGGQVNQGCCAQPRSPASQNTMPRSCPLSAIASNTEITAPQALASTTPESSKPARIRTAPHPVHQSPDRQRSAGRASIPVPRAQSPQASRRARRPRRRPKRRARRDRPEDCETEPEAARRPAPEDCPTANAEIVRGSRIVRTIVGESSSPPPPSAASAWPSDRCADPASREASKAAERQRAQPQQGPQLCRPDICEA